MKKNSIVFYAFLLLAAACSKSDKSPSPSSGAGISASVSAQLAKTDSLGDFAKFFNATTLTDAATSGGVTILAPSNNAFGNAQITSTAQLPDGSTANDYIIKGILKASDFVNGKTLTTLSGKTLTVSVVADPIVLVNGMIINTSSGVASPSGTWMLFSAAQMLNAPPPVFITVRDATKWSSSNPQGLPVTAMVQLYSSQTAPTPAYTGITDADGVAIINGVQPGQYYVEAFKGTLNSLFSPYAENSNGLLGYAADTVIDSKGNVVFKDINGDQIINAQDLTTVPYQQIQATKDKPAQLTILIGTLFPSIPNYAAATDTLNAVYAGLTATYQNLLIMDGMLSDDADCSGNANWCPFDNFGISAVLPVLSTIWNDAYFNNLNKLNHLLRDIYGLPDATDAQKSQMLAETYALRDYIYLEMATYFGGLPQETDLGKDFYPYIARTSASAVLNAVESDLVTQSASLPVTRSDGKQGLTQYAALALAAKAALVNKNYSGVASHCASVKNSGQYSLASRYSWLTSQNTTETIWAPNFSAIASYNAWYYTGAFPSTTVQYCPVIRYGEILLMDAEAQIALNNLSAATTDINIIRSRDGLGTISSGTTQYVDSTLQATWPVEMYRQGDRYASITRWAIGDSVLSAKGYHNSFDDLMPIPQTYLINYMDIVQNPGF